MNPNKLLENLDISLLHKNLIVYHLNFLYTVVLTLLSYATEKQDNTSILL